MPRYDDDQCEECGAIRISGSRLCTDCMVRMITRLENRITNKREDVDGLKDTVKTLNGRLKDSLNYGFKKNRENAKLLQYIKHLEFQNIGRWINETNSERENKEE